MVEVDSANGKTLKKTTTKIKMHTKTRINDNLSVY